MTTAPLSVHSGHLQTDKGLTSNDITPRRHVARSQSWQLENARDGLKDVPSLRDLDSNWERAHRARKKKNSNNGEGEMRLASLLHSGLAMLAFPPFHALLNTLRG